MKNYLQILCFLCAAAFIIGAFCVSSHKRAEQAYLDGAMDLQSSLPTNALVDFSRAIQLDPKFVSAYLGRADAQYNLKDFTNTIEDCTTVIGLDPTNEHAFYIRGVAKQQLHDFDGATGDLGKAISLDSDDQQALLYRGFVLIQTRDWDGSKTDFTRVLRLCPDYAQACLGRAMAEIKLKEYENVITDASNVIQWDSSTAAAAYCLRAGGKAGIKDRAGTFEDANQAVKLLPKSAPMYVIRATCDILWDDFSSASNDMQTVIQLSPTNTDFFTCRAMLEHKRGQTVAAISDYNKSLALNPDNFEAPEAYEAMGHLEWNLSNWPQALKDFQKAAAVKSPPEEASFGVFLTECRLGQTSQARNELNAYMQAIPSSKTNDWMTSVAHFLAGNLNETDFLAQATTTAKRPTDIPGQTCDAYYYEGMQRLFAGDKANALADFQKSVDTREDNAFTYLDALNELTVLKNP